MRPRLLWDIFCTVIDNHGDLGVCWRLSRQLRDAGQRVRLWVDDASALDWMAPGLARGQEPDIEIRCWDEAAQAAHLHDLPASDVWIEAFGCHIPKAFIAQGVARCAEPPVWINLEYLSAEEWVERHHGLPSPVLSGPARGWTKRFFYPGFTPKTGGLLREAGLLQRQLSFDRVTWRRAQAPDLPPGAKLFSLFCYEPAGLGQLLRALAESQAQLLVTPGRPAAAVRAALTDFGALPHWKVLPYTDQDGFDHMLWACDLNFVRGEDSWVRALWAGQPFIWQIYPQEDQAHHAKLEAFLDWLQAPPCLRQFHRVWNGIEQRPLPALDTQNLSAWTACAQAARQRLLAQDDLLTGLFKSVLA